MKTPLILKKMKTANRTLKFNIDLTPKQQEAYNLLMQPKTKRLTCAWSRQSGKSTFAQIMCIIYLISTRNAFVGYITPTFSLSRKVFRELLSLLENTGYVEHANSSTLTIKSITGSIIQFFSQEAYRSIRGHTISGLLVIDEAAYMQDILPNGESFWGNVVQPITKTKKPKILVISTPCGRSGFFFDFFNQGNYHDCYKILKATIYEDPNTSKEEIEQIKNDISPIAFKQEYECEFLADALTVFNGYEHCFKNYNFLDGQPVWVGIDLSSIGEDNTVITLINRDYFTKQYIIDGPLDYKYKKMADILNGLKTNKILIETNGIGAPMINEVRKLTKKPIDEWVTTNSSKNEIIGELANAITNKSISFEEDNDTLRRELGDFTYTISKTKKLTFAAKNGGHDDTVMSMAIALHARNSYQPTTQENLRFIRSNIRQIR